MVVVLVVAVVAVVVAAAGGVMIRSRSNDIGDNHDLGCRASRLRFGASGSLTVLEKQING